MIFFTKPVRYTFILFLFLSLSGIGFAQKGFGLDGILGTVNNSNNQVYSLFLESRMQFNDYFSTSLGLGLWNSGYKDSWFEAYTNDKTATMFRLTDNQTIPGIQLNLRGQFPLFRVSDRLVKLFVEPRLFFLPFSARTVHLNETYLETEVNSETGNEYYVKRNVDPIYEGTLKSDCVPRFYWGLQGGFLVNLNEDIDLSISYGYSNLDLFRDLRGLSIKGHEVDTYYELDPYFSEKHLLQLNVGFIYNFYLD